MGDRETVDAELRATKGAVKPTSILSVTRIEQSLAGGRAPLGGLRRNWKYGAGRWGNRDS